MPTAPPTPLDQREAELFAGREDELRPSDDFSPSCARVSTGGWTRSVRLSLARGRVEPHLAVAEPRVRAVGRRVGETAMGRAVRGVYDAFVSYAWPDRELVGQLVRELEKRGLEVWFDGHSVAAGESFDRVIREAIDRARACVIVLSPASDPSQAFTSKERSTIQEASWRRDEMKLCAVRLGDVPLPPFLSRWQSLTLAESPRDLEAAADQIAALLRGAGIGPLVGAAEHQRSIAAARIASLQRALLQLKTEEAPAESHEQGS